MSTRLFKDIAGGEKLNYLHEDCEKFFWYLNVFNGSIRMFNDYILNNNFQCIYSLCSAFFSLRH